MERGGAQRFEPRKQQQSEQGDSKQTSFVFLPRSVLLLHPTTHPATTTTVVGPPSCGSATSARDINPRNDDYGEKCARYGQYARVCVCE